MHKLVGLIVILILISSLQNVFGEQYYYFQDAKLSHLPLFCMIDFTDPQLPQANKILLDDTRQAIDDWKSNLIQRTNHQDGWNFQSKLIPIGQKDNFLETYQCDVTISYEREPVTSDDKDLGGITHSSGGYSDVTIYYIQPNYSPTGKTILINGQEMDEYHITGYGNELDPQVGVTIRHEIGHSLGLDHPKFTEKDFTRDSSGNLVSPSVMVDASTLILEQDPIYKITSYDIDSLVNLYGEVGMSEFSFWDFSDYIILAIILVILVFAIRRWKKRRSRTYLKRENTLDGILINETYCPKCNNIISNDWEFCNNCGTRTRESCVKCGSYNPKGYLFCVKCGSSP